MLEDASAVQGVAEDEEAPGGQQLPSMDVDSAGGGGAINLDEAPVTGKLTFSEKWLRKHGIDWRRAAVINVRGDSMAPTLPDGAKILVARNRRRRLVGRIYVISTADGLICV